MCFYRCLNSKLPSVENLVEILRSLCQFINKNLSKESIREKLSKQFPEENMECWTTISSITDKIEKAKNKKKADNVFLILLYELGLFLFSEPKSIEMAKSSIKELVSCYDHYKRDKKKAKDSSLKEGIVVDGEPEWIEVLTEVLLSILSVDSSVLRSIVQCVFRLLFEYLTPSSIGQIVSVLDPENDSNPLLQDSDDSDDGSANGDEKTDDEKDDNDSGKGSDEENESNDDSDNDTEFEDIDGEEDKVNVPDQLRIALQKALGNAAPDSDAESVDIDNMTEEEGKKLDQALAEAFKQFNEGKNKKTKKDRKDKKTLSDFRIRALDLVDIYLEKEPPMDICLGMIAPLVRGLEYSLQDDELKDLENRLRKTIKNLTKIKKFASTEGVTIEMLCEYLKTTVDKGNRSNFIYQALGDIVTNCGAFLIQCAQKLNLAPKKYKEFNQMYIDFLVSFFKNRNCLLPVIFFHNIVELDWVGKYSLIPVAIENAFNTNVRHFRRNEALELITNYYKSLHRFKTPPTAAIKKNEAIFESNVKSALVNKEFVAKENFFKSLNKVFVSMKLYYKTVDGTPDINIDELIKFVIGNKVITKQKSDNHLAKAKLNSGEIKKLQSAKKKEKKKQRKQENIKRKKLENGHAEVPHKKLKTSEENSD